MALETMPRAIHETYDYFDYVRVEDSLPPADPDVIEVALLDLNHSWPNLGHDSLAHAVLEIAQALRNELEEAGLRIRVLSFDVRRKHVMPELPGGRFKIYVGTGGPGHLDPRLNDGIHEWSQGISESADWEAGLFRLFESIVASPDASLFAVCHSFGLLCRWSGIARVELRAEKSSGMPTNVLTDAAVAHPWFSEFSSDLPDGRHFRVLDNRLFDLIIDRPNGYLPIALEESGSGGLTMVELARDRDGVMPRVLGVNFHPEIIDRDHILTVLDEKRMQGEVTETWYAERATTMRDMFHGEAEQQSQLTSWYSLLGPLRHQIERAVRERAGVVA